MLEIQVMAFLDPAEALQNGPKAMVLWWQLSWADNGGLHLQNKDAILDADATTIAGGDVVGDGAGVHGHHAAGRRVGVCSAGAGR